MVTYDLSRMRALEKLRLFCRPRNRTLKEVSLEVINLFELHLDAGSQKSSCDALEEYLKNTDKI